MAYDRYDTRRDYGRRDDNDRGFFEKAGDEISSWFGDDNNDRYRRGERMNRGDRNRDYERGRGDDRYVYGDWGGLSEDRERGYERDYDRDRYDYRGYGRDWDGDREPRRWHDEQHSYQPMNWSSSNRAYSTGGYDRGRSSGWGDYDRDFGPRGYGSDRARNTGPSYRERDYEGREFGGGYGPSENQWAQDDYRSTSYAGSIRDNDRHYSAWRNRQLDELDRDYEQYSRERRERFDDDFGSWREERMSKREQLGGIREHMDVVGSDGERIGKVDCVKGDRIVLTKSDSPDNRHHAIDCSMIDTIEGDQVRLDMPAEEAKSRWEDAENRGFFGRGPRHEGPNLERSFSGTYED